MKSNVIDWNDKAFPIQDLNIDALNRVFTQICADFRFNPGRLAITVVSDNQLWEMNKKHLNHNTLTDVITFPYNIGDYISGEIFISADRACDNASKTRTTMSEEVLRYAIHGMLHLNGKNDSTPDEKTAIHKLEDKYIKKYHLFHVKP